MGAKVEASREEGSGGLTKVWLRRESLSEPSTGIYVHLSRLFIVSAGEA